uniref:Putative tick defensin n=1 Tax=Rhipicephalus pulchellus TaxID=72859 RepID=L7MAN5_RHIPC
MTFTVKFAIVLMFLATLMVMHVSKGDDRLLRQCANKNCTPTALYNGGCGSDCECIKRRRNNGYYCKLAI